MARLTKSEIEKALLAGSGVSYLDSNGTPCSLQLSEARQRRLFEYLLSSSVRSPTGLSSNFISGLKNAFAAIHDPAVQSANSIHQSPPAVESWKLSSIETEGFGGLNTWEGQPFTFDFGRDSFILEGPNGSGKSSLIGAVIWALTGQRVRDQSDIPELERRPVYDAGALKPVGHWPPLACYPTSIADIASTPTARVRLTFADDTGATAIVERKLAGGAVSSTTSQNFAVPQIFIETGLLMPARMSRIRLNDTGNGLKGTIQQLTGLDDLVAIGTLASGLCHASREFRNYRSKDLATLVANFRNAMEVTRNSLVRVSKSIPDFNPMDAEDTVGAMVALGKELSELAATQANVVQNDLHSGLQLAQTRIQNDVVEHIGAARQDIEAGLTALPTWQKLSVIKNALDPEAATKLVAATTLARQKLEEARLILAKSKLDSRFRLKAVGAHWHEEHSSGPIKDCPLCATPIGDMLLGNELEDLRRVGEAATRAFIDNVNAIVSTLNKATPNLLLQFDVDFLALEPRKTLIGEIRGAFIDRDRYRLCLVKVAQLVEDALAGAPGDELPASEIPQSSTIENEAQGAMERIAVVERILAIRRWLDVVGSKWENWWNNLAEDRAPPNTGDPSASSTESLKKHLRRISDALEKSEPYRTAVESMRRAFKDGKEAAEIQREVNLRNEIAENLAPLKTLVALCDWTARTALEELSDRIGLLLKDILVAEQLQYQCAALDRREGIKIQASFTSDFRVDATLVANTSWLRAVLWAFVFALRGEAVERLGNDPMPLMMFDDPQATFDDYHRSRWSNYIAKLQSHPPGLQVVIATYDTNFVDLVKMDGIRGREGLIAAAGARSDTILILEGEKVDRAWVLANKEKTPKAAQDYLADVREYVEGLLKLTARGRDADVRLMALGDLRDLLERSHKSGPAPWDSPHIATVVSLLQKTRPETKYIEGSHHTTGRSFGMQEATEVHKLWRKLKPALEGAYRTIRDYRKLHGGMDMLFSTPASATMPLGHQTAVGAIPLKILGRAAALTDGRAADGAIDMSEFASAQQVKITLGKHSAFRLSAPTLEPVARKGDILLTKDYGEASNKSLVIARFEDRLLARRLEISDNVSDVAALTAQAINPREIAAPIVVHRGALDLRKIIGVIFASDRFQQPSTSNDEICDCGGQAALTRVSRSALGLVQVEGKSAEPLALDKQYLIVQYAISPAEAAQTQQGKPAIAEDLDGMCYFKRLRFQEDGSVVLESLDSGGEYPPIVLAPAAAKANCLKKVWPVAGILFEIPRDR